ncbi:MAG TPA: VWA domain-containing protein [Candidatus Binatia bacterium]|jgi:Mg-chelatase subunit ChlD|nr:VWA domain-containing protein [Candidatus Binatia bacterium]
MTPTVLEPRMLLLLLALPLLLIGLRRDRRRAAALRALAATAVVLVLAGARLERDRAASGACVIAAIDVSQSVGRASLATAARVLPALDGILGPDDLLGAVAFGGRSQVIAHPADGRPTVSALLADAATADVDPDATDLAAALSTASALCPDDRQATLLLLSDGRETRGDLVAEAALGASAMAVFAVEPQAPDLPPTTIRRLLVPATASAGAAIPIEAVVENHAPAPVEVTLTLTANGTVVAERGATLPPGASVVGLPWRSGAPGPVALDVTIGGQPLAGSASATLTVTTAPHVLVVSDREHSVVAAALAARGMTVTRVPPRRLGRLDAVHAVVLDDVGHGGFAPGSLETLSRWVARGGALVVTGGRHLFGDPGFVASPLEPLLPVTLQSQAPEPKEREPIALFLVIDRSNSMGYGQGEKMEYARRAAVAVLEQLGPRDLVGAVAFDSQPYELGALRPAAHGRAALEERIRALQYGGGTDWKDALELARKQLVAGGRRVRHVILLTDGDSNRRADDHTALIADLARDGITVTSIRIGSDTVNLELLQDIAHATGGEFHHVADAEALPQLMIRDTRRLMDAPGSLVNAPARIGETGPMLSGVDERELPAVARWAVTRARPEAEMRLWLDTGTRHDPLLATWQVELGRVAALPVDFQSGAAAWAQWDGFGKLWAQVVHWAMAPTLRGDRRLVARRGVAGLEVTLDTGAVEDGPFTLRLGGSDDVALRPIGPHTFRGVAPALRAGVVPAVLRTAVRDEPSALVVPASASDGRELRHVGADLPLLQAVAVRTGGAVDPPLDALVAARPGAVREAIPLAPFLIPLALLALLADIALRRFS